VKKQCRLLHRKGLQLAHCGGSRQGSDAFAIKENQTLGRHRQHRRA
jgi:hypothetical protein